jgi:hypothetical protein
MIPREPALAPPVRTLATGFAPAHRAAASPADQLRELLALPDVAIEHALAERIRRAAALDEDVRHAAPAREGVGSSV